MRRVLERGAEALVSLTHNMAALLLAIGTALVFWQVVTRFVLHDSAAWSEVLARGVVIWMVFLAAGAGFRLNAMIPLEFLRSVLPERLKRWVGLAVLVLVLLFLGVLAFFGMMLTIRVSTQRIAMLDVPIAWFYAAIPVGALLAVPGVLLGYFKPVARPDEDAV